LIKQLQLFMSRNGIPRKFYSDQGSAYESHEFEQFCHAWGIELITCSGEYPKGNGTAEAAVKRVKKWIKGSNSQAELAKAILAWHQTPMTPGRPTPAQLHLGRNLRDEINLHVSKSDVDWKEVQAWKTAQKALNAETYDKHARELKPLKPGQRVFVQIHGKWRKAVIESLANRPRSYVLRMTDTGARVERNRIHLREDLTGQKKCENGLLFFFTAQEARTEKTTTRNSVDSRRTTNEENSAQSSRGEPRRSNSSPQQVVEENPDLEPEPEPETSAGATDRPSKKTKTKRIDPERAFLDKEKVSQYGRVSKKVQPLTL
jgi:hypothetical protein